MPTSNQIRGFRLIFAVLLPLLFLRAHAADESETRDAPLRLIAVSGNEEFDAFEFADGQIVTGRKGATTPLPRAVRWRLSTEPRVHPALAAYAVTYNVRRYPPLHAAPMPEPAFAASVFLERGRPGGWPDSTLKDAIAVFVWMVGAGPREIVAVPTALTVATRRTDFPAIHTFDLTEESAAGHPLILLWKNGGFIAPEPLFDDTEAQRCATLLFTGAEGPELVQLLARSTSSKARARDHTTLLHLAAEAGLTNAIEVLLAGGADPNLDAGTGDTPLSWAAGNGRRAAVQQLLAAAHPSLPRGGGAMSALDNALPQGHIDVGLDLLPHNGCNIPTAAAVAADHRRADLLDGILRDQPARVLANLPAEVLAELILNGHTGIMQQLLAHGAPAKAADRGTPLLLFAAYLGNTESAVALLQSGADVDASDENGVTALMLAGQDGTAELARAVIDAGGAIQKRDKQKRTALHFAAASGNRAVVDLLLVRGADPNPKDADGATPLDLACGAGWRDVAERLLTAGAKLDRRSRHFATTVGSAIVIDCVEVLQAAQQSGWKPEKTLIQDWEPWDIAQAVSASEALAWLKAKYPRAAPGNLAVESKPDQLPRAKQGGRPADVRRKDHDLPEQTLRVKGVVDRRGQFLFPRVLNCDDPGLSHAILQAAPSWEFEPAQKGGAPVLAELVVAFTLPAWESTTYARAEVDSAPFVLQRSPVDRHTTISELRTRSQIVLVTRRHITMGLSPGGTIQRSVNVVNDREFVPVTEHHERQIEIEGSWATLRAVIEPDGKPGFCTIVDTDDQDFGTAAAAALKRYQFSPATRAGQPVRSAITLIIRE